jgi:hypothetical protein
MSAFRLTTPVIRRKQAALDVQDLEGLWHIGIQVRDVKLFSSSYTRIDQVFLLWGTICAVIFMAAQFLTIDWRYQAVIWSILTIIGSWGTYRLAWYWVTIEGLRWVVYVWVGLMLCGVGITDWGMFGGGWWILSQLAPLWLGLCAIGYLITGWGLRSRAFLVSSVLHLIGVMLLACIPDWQFLVTGLITAGCLFFLAAVQWDMSSNPDSQRLTVAQKQFNLAQQEQRDLDR